MGAVKRSWTLEVVERIILFRGSRVCFFPGNHQSDSFPNWANAD